MGKSIVLPEYFAESLARHMAVIVRSARVERGNVRAQNALRLARGETARLARMIEEQTRKNDGEDICGH